MQAPEIIDEKIAQEFINDSDAVELRAAKELTDEAAEILAGYEGGLYLTGLTSLSDAAAESLSKHVGDLNFSSWDQSGLLTSLSDAAAESLSKHEGGLNLSGLTTLSDAAAESFSRHEGVLLFEGLTTLTDAAAESLSKHEGGLYLGRFLRFSDQAAESLSRYEGDINEGEFADYITWRRRQMHILVESEPEKILESEAGSTYFEKIYEVDAKINGEVIRFRQHQTEKFGEFYYYDKESEKWKSTCELKNGQHIKDCLDNNGGIDFLEKGDEWDDELEGA